MKVLDISCTACGALPGQKCFNVGIGDQRVTGSGNHQSRVRRAHYATLGERLSKNAARKAAKK